MRSEIFSGYRNCEKNVSGMAGLVPEMYLDFMLFAVALVPKWYIHTWYIHNSCVMMARYCELLRKHLSIPVKSRHYPARS